MKRINVLMSPVLLLLTTALPAAGQDGPGFGVMTVTAITNRWIAGDAVPADAVADGAIELAACRGEYESGSFVIQAGQALEELRVSASELAGQAGTIPASAVDVSVVKVWYQSGRGIYIEKDKHYLTPELLLKDDGLVTVDREKKVNVLKYGFMEMRDADELQPFDVAAGKVMQLWVTVQVPA